jgi:P27 family predicted phage terminase small subunit
MSKHLTKEAMEARQAAESSVNPDRGTVTLKKPPWLIGKGKAYWDSILARMADTAILDDLDTEMLAIYCAQLQERDALQNDLKKARKAEELDMDLILALTKQLNAKDSKIREFASELGCTPSGRVRLAQKRAAKAAEADQDGDLFGD